MNRRLWLVLAGYLLITIAYGIVNPLFEAPDEHWHYFTAQYIADTGQLPVVEERYDTWLSQEAAQPPLYYLLGSFLIAPIDTDGAREEVWLNPFSPQGIGNAAALANKNIAVHTPAEAWPWQGYVLAAHLLRLFSTLLGLGTLLGIYGCGRLLWPHDETKAWLATALIAFLPQFNFSHAAITNDTLITFLTTMALWQLLYLWLNQVTRQRLLWLGITIGFAALTKTAGLLLLIYAVGFLGLLALRTHRLRTLLPQILLFVLLPTLLIAGWLWWRNASLYGDFTAANQFIHIAGGDRNYTLLQVLAESNSLWTSLFAVFGWFNVLPPTWLFAIWNGIVMLGLLGALWQQSWQRPTIPSVQSLLRAKWMPALLLALWLLVTYAGLVTFMLQTPAAQGRLLFPALVPLALGLSYGLSRWRITQILPLIALFTTLYSLLFVIPPAYATPPTLSHLPDSATPLHAEVGQGVLLVGAEIETATAVATDITWFTLYWQRDSTPSTETPEFVLELFGRDLNLIGNIHSYHGRGLYPAPLWPPHTIIADRFGVQLSEEIEAPVLANAFARLADDHTDTEGVHIGTIKVIPTSWPQVNEPPFAQIGDRVTITAVSLDKSRAVPGETITIDIQWHVIAPVERHYTTLVHLTEAGQPPLAQGDRPPLNGQYPTSVWAAGEVINDYYQITVPQPLQNCSEAPCRYPLWLGLYDSETIVRLPLTINGQRQPHDTLLIGEIEIVPSP